MPQSLDELLQSISDVMFPADEGREVAIDSVGYDGDTPLHVMAWRNDLESVRILLAAGAGPNAQGEMDETPLHVAIRQDNLPMISAMLEAGARDDIRSKFGEPPREAALKKGGAVAGLFGKSR
jgi:ankyrin repeat protein